MGSKRGGEAPSDEEEKQRILDSSFNGLAFLRRCRLPPFVICSGSSTTQTYLAKIISIISTVPPDSAPLPPAPPDVDLDLKLGPPQEKRREILPSVSVNHLAQAEESTVGKAATEEHQVSGAESSALEKSSVGECSPDADRIQQKDAKETSEVTDTQVDDIVCGEAKGSAAEGYLDLLLDAARQVGGDRAVDETVAKRPRDLGAFMDDSGMKKASTASAVKSRRRRASRAKVFDTFEETEPVVRSKRGRSQALPSRFRDSVLGPWRKLPTILRR